VKEEALKERMTERREEKEFKQNERMKRQRRQNKEKHRKLKDEKAQENPEDCVGEDIMQDIKREAEEKGIAEEIFLCL
jgi:hypothetical protein